MKKITEYLTTVEVARELGVSKARIDQFARVGKLKSVTVGNARLFLKTDVCAFAKIPRNPGRKPKKK